MQTLPAVYGAPLLLQHPLPPGMRDRLPGEAALRSALSRRLLDTFLLYGYRRVTPPVFEFERVVGPAGSRIASSDMLRFIEPESGDVAVLSPDLTPQVARIVATRLAGLPAPHRLAYEGVVVRRRAGRAKKHREIPQVGVEACGLADPSGDEELLALVVAALEGVGLERFILELSDAGILRGLLEGMGEERAQDLRRALAAKDEAGVRDAARGATHGQAFEALSDLSGEVSVLAAAKPFFRGTGAEAALERLVRLATSLERAGLAERVRFDLGEVRGFAYYTGTLFSIYAEGAPEAVGRGGRYDDLLRRFGTDLPASGFALDVDLLQDALRVAGASGRAAPSVLVVGGVSDPRLAALRACKVSAAALSPGGDPAHYARAWGFDVVWDEGAFWTRREGEITLPKDPSAGARELARVLETD